MLQTIREHTQGWIAGVIVSLIILSFALWGIHSYFVGGSSNNVVAEVNGVEISHEQLTTAYERLRRQAQTQAPITNKDESVLKDRALNVLIDVEVLKQASLAQGFRVSDQQIDSYLQAMPEFQVNGQFSVERFQELLSSSLLSTGEFLELIKTSLLIDQPKMGIILSSFALPDETAYTLSLVNQERDIQYIEVPFQQFLKDPIVISRDQVKAYYEQHQREFMTPDQVTVDYVLLSLKDIEATMTPTEPVLRNFYNDNINSYTQPRTWKLADIEIAIPANSSSDDIAKIQKQAEEVKDAILKGQDFNKTARTYKQSLMGQEWTSLAQVAPELQKPVSELKVGDVSAPIQTDKAFIIVKAVEVKEPSIQSYEAVQDKVKEAYVRQHAEEKFAEAREQLADVAYEHSDSLATVSSKLGLPVQTSELFSKDKAGEDISQYKKVRDIAFSDDVLNLQNNSDVIQINPESVIVLRVKSHIPAALLPLGQVSAQIEEKLKAEQAEILGVQYVKNLQAKLNAGNDPEAIAKENHLTWNNTGYLGRYSKKIDPAILDLAFRLPNPTANKNKTLYGLTRIPGGYAIAAVKGVKAGENADQAQTAVFAEQVQNSDGLLEYELYKESQTKNAKIKLEQ